MKKTILVLIAAICLVGIGAAESDASTVKATVNAKLTIDAPDTEIVLGAYQPDETATSGDIPITVESNKNYQVTATASGSSLNLPLMVLLEDGTTYSDATSGPMIFDDVKPGTTFNTKVQQTFNYNDAPGTYSITLTFAATQP